MKSDKTKPEAPRQTYSAMFIGACEHGGFAVYRPRSLREGPSDTPRPLYAGKLNKCLSFIANHIERRPEEPDYSDFIDNMRRTQAGRPEGEPT